MPELTLKPQHSSKELPGSREDHQPSAGAVALLVTALFALQGAVFIAIERVPSRVFYDQELYHRPTISQFVAQWPNFDFWHYLSATTPGYHLLMAAVAKVISPSILTLQVVSMIISVVLVWTLSLDVARRTKPMMTLTLVAPFLFSPYVIGSGAWLLPDNLGWLGVLCILVIALRPRLTTNWMIAGALILLGLVFVRQIHLWAAGLLWASAWIRPGPAEQDLAPAAAEASTANPFFFDLKTQVSKTLACLLFTLPAFALVGLFFRYWGGPVPPVFQTWFHTYNLSAGAFILTLFGVWGVFFSFTWVPHLIRFWRTRRAWLVTILVLGSLYTMAVPTNPDYDTGRRSGLWGVAERFPVFAHHTSPLIVGLALLGVLTLAGLLFATPIRQRLIFLAAIAGFAAANTANNDLFQRYVDPFVLMLLALLGAAANNMAASGSSSTGSAGRGLSKMTALQLVGPLVLAALFGVMSLRTITRNNDRGQPDYSHINEPPPPPRYQSAHDNLNDPNSKQVPCQMPRPPMPPGKHFWPWS